MFSSGITDAITDYNSGNMTRFARYTQKLMEDGMSPTDIKQLLREHGLDIDAGRAASAVRPTISQTRSSLRLVDARIAVVSERRDRSGFADHR